MISVMTFENILQIKPRFEAGTIQNDVDRSQGRKGLDVQLQGATPEQAKLLQDAHNRKVERGMTELRKYLRCVNEALGLSDVCKTASPK